MGGVGGKAGRVRDRDRDRDRSAVEEGAGMAP